MSKPIACVVAAGRTVFGCFGKARPLNTSPEMIKALLLMFEPAATWERIATARRSILYILLTHLAPLLLVGAVAEGYGLKRWGEWQKDVLVLKHFEEKEAVLFEAAQTVLLLAVVFIAAKTIKSMGDTFHGRHTFTQAFTVVAYGMSPMLLVRILDASRLTPWLAWTIGALLMISILYHGVPRVMEPDPSHAFGLYLTSWLLLVLITGVLRFATGAYLNGTLKI